MSAGQRIAAGTAVLLRGLPGLVWAGEWGESIARWLLAGLVGSIGITAMAVHWWLIPVAVVLWCAVAAGAAPDAEEEPEEDQWPSVGDGYEGEYEEDELLDVDAFRELLRDVAHGENVHLVTVRAQLAEETGREWSGPEARALCERAGVRVRDGVRVPHSRPAVTTGIHRDDLPPLPSPAWDAPVGVVGAGQHDNNNSNSVIEVGQGGLLVPDMMRGARR